MSGQIEPPKGVNGKWIVIIMMPIVVISFIWLAYFRMNFVHPTSISTRHVPSQATGPVK